MLGTIQIDGKELLKDVTVSIREFEDFDSPLKDCYGSFRLSSFEIIHTQEFVEFCNSVYNNISPVKLNLEDEHSFIIMIEDCRPSASTSLIYFKVLEVLI